MNVFDEEIWPVEGVFNHLSKMADKVHMVHIHLSKMADKVHMVHIHLSKMADKVHMVHIHHHLVLFLYIPCKLHQG
jgi:hypothetical protein